MTITHKRQVLTVVLAAICASFFMVGEAVRGADAKKARNVILFIGDGNGFNSELMGTYYHTGKEWGEVYHKFPVVLGSAHFSIHTHSGGPKDWDPEGNPKDNLGYVPEEFWKGPEGADWHPYNTGTTDSSASATAINTGVKTYNGYVGVDIRKNRLENFAEKNIKAGRAVGIVSTNQICHATPAGATAHSDNRGNYEALSKEQINDLALTVLMGSGHPEYENGVKVNKNADELNYQFVGGRETWEKVKANDGYKGWSFIDEKSDFAALAESTPDSGKKLPKKLLAVVRCNGDVPPIDGDVDDPKAMVEKYTQETVDAIPSLTQMTLATLNVVSQNKNGFYVMVEGGSIDHANHSRNARNSCLEHTGLAKAIEAAIDWVEKYSSWDETLLIVTADHETGAVWGDGTYTDENNNGKWDSDKDTFEGFEKIEKTAAGEIPAVQYLTTGHTNGLVPFYAKGAGAKSALDFVRGNDKKAGKFWKFSGDFIYNSDVFNVMMKASDLK